MDKVEVGGFEQSYVFAGVAHGLIGLADPRKDFVETAKIREFTVTGAVSDADGAQFIDGILSAPGHRERRRSGSSPTAEQGPTCGLSASSIARLRYRLGGQEFDLKNLETFDQSVRKGSFTASLDSTEDLGFTFGVLDDTRSDLTLPGIAIDHLGLMFQHAAEDHCRFLLVPGDFATGFMVMCINENTCAAFDPNGTHLPSPLRSPVPGAPRARRQVRLRPGQEPVSHAGQPRVLPPGRRHAEPVDQVHREGPPAERPFPRDGTRPEPRDGREGVHLLLPLRQHPVPGHRRVRGPARQGQRPHRPPPRPWCRASSATGGCRSRSRRSRRTAPSTTASPSATPRSTRSRWTPPWTPPRPPPPAGTLLSRRLSGSAEIYFCGHEHFYDHTIIAGTSPPGRDRHRRHAPGARGDGRRGDRHRSRRPTATTAPPTSGIPPGSTTTTRKSPPPGIPRGTSGTTWSRCRPRRHLRVEGLARQQPVLILPCGLCPSCTVDTTPVIKNSWTYTISRP